MDRLQYGSREVVRHSAAMATMASTHCSVDQGMYAYNAHMSCGRISKYLDLRCCVNAHHSTYTV